MHTLITSIQNFSLKFHNPHFIPYYRKHKNMHLSSSIKNKNIRKYVNFKLSNICVEPRTLAYEPILSLGETHVSTNDQVVCPTSVSLGVQGIKSPINHPTRNVCLAKHEQRYPYFESRPKRITRPARITGPTTPT